MEMVDDAPVGYVIHHSLDFGRGLGLGGSARNVRCQPALSTGGASFVARALVGRARTMCRFTALARDLAYTASIHCCETSTTSGRRLWVRCRGVGRFVGRMGMRVDL